MKNVWLHGLYLSIVGFLAFQLYSTTKARDLAYEQVEEVLKKDFVIMNETANSYSNAVEKNCLARASTYMEYYYSKNKRLKKISKYFEEYINKQVMDTEQGKILKFKDLRDSLLAFSEALNSLEQDTFRKREVNEKHGLKHFIDTDSFTISFKKNPKLLLLAVRNQMKTDEIEYLSYALYRTTEQGLICGPVFRLAMSPRKGTVLEGETFDAEFYIASYSSNPGTDIVFTVNGQKLLFKDGVGHFSNKVYKTGLKTLYAQVNVKNPMTGELKTLKNEFQYHVLPKCSQNCQ
jgi:hypothetical protein